MAQLAEMTAPAGGKALAPEELPVAAARRSPPNRRSSTKKSSPSVTYWDTWPFFLVFVALLGGEWYLRKRWGLVVQDTTFLTG